jgi:hypothetical protein
MEPGTPSETTIRLEDLRVITDLGLLRLPAGDAEARRATAMRALADAAVELTRALASHTRCFLVNCQGSHGAGNLADETEHFHLALAQYAALVRATVHERQQIDGSTVSAHRRGTSVREPRPVSGAAQMTLRRAV